MGDDYEAKIREALAKGLTLPQIKENLAKNIKQTEDGMRTLKEQLDKLQGLHSFVNDFMGVPSRIMPDVETVRSITHMSSSQLRQLMSEKKITSRELAKASARTYTQIVDYRRGAEPVPLDIANIVKEWKV